MKLRNLLLLMLVSGLLYHGELFASWNGPNVVIQGNWGTGENNFGYEKGELKDNFPDSIAVLPDGRILIVDDMNVKLKIFNATGQLLKSVKWDSLGLTVLNSDAVISCIGDEQGHVNIGAYSLSKDQWLWVDSSTDVGLTILGKVYVSPKQDIYLWNNHNKGFHYSALGVLIATFTSKPLVFGNQESSQKMNDGIYLSIIKFDDLTYRCKTPTPFSAFSRDVAGNLYGSARVSDGGLHTRVYKITKCGKVSAIVDLPPKKKHDITYAQELPAYSRTVVDEEYGSPVITPNGDVYTWKRTPYTYSILKWTWVDDSNLPKESCNEQAPAPRQ